MNNYTFEKEVQSKLPPYLIYKRMYPVNDKETVIEVSDYEGNKSFIMRKVDLGTLFPNSIVLTVEENVTFNHLYATVSSMYGLGLVIGIDYYNNDLIKLNGSESVLESLPILSDSYGYRGSINVILINKNNSIPRSLPIKDLSTMKTEYYLTDIKVKSSLVSRVFKSSPNSLLFSGDRISSHFHLMIMEYLKNEFDTFTIMEWESAIGSSVVTDLINDGLSDIVVLSSLTKKSILVRFVSKIGDLPILGEIPSDTNEDEIIIDFPDDEIIIDL